MTPQPTNPTEDKLRGELEEVLQIKGLRHTPGRPRLVATPSQIDSLVKIVNRERVKALDGLRIGFLRQALNEDRITDSTKMIDNDYIEHWLDIKKLKSVEEKK